MVDEDQALPMMSFSPVSAAPSSVTYWPPRAFSRVPLPVPLGWLCEALLGFDTVSALRRLSAPDPWAAAETPESGVAVVFSMFLSVSGPIQPCCCRSSAAAPDTTAAACDVPLPRRKLLPIRAD